MLKNLKTLLFIIFILILSFGINCVKFPEDVEFNNPVDPEAPNYVGIPSVDLDGDGISSYIDVDDIIIISPADGTVTSDGTPTLIVYKFDPSLVKRYYIQVSTSENDFENNIVHENDNISTHFYAIPAGILENNTTYYWWAKAHDGNKWSDNWSHVFSFTLDITIQVPTIPYPIDNSIIIDTTPVLDWEDVYDATEYHIQVNTEIDFDEIMIVDDENVIQSTYSIITVLENNKTYYWRVKIKNEDEIWGDWSQVWNFDIQIEKPLIPSPSNGSSVSDATPLLNWEDINTAIGYEIEVNESNDFKGTIMASDNTLTISEYQITAPLVNNTTYYWRVKIKNEDEIWGDWGNTWSFTVLIYALEFDGNDLVETTLLDNSDTITVSAWVKVSGRNGEQDIVCNFDGSGYGLIYDLWGSNKFSLSVYIGGYKIIFSDAIVQQNIWHYVVGTYDGDNGYLYVDGIKQVESFDDNGAIRDSPYPIIIGANPEGSGFVRHFIGMIDEVSIWNIALEEQEIQDIMNQRLVGTEDGLNGYWRFDEGGGQIVEDLSINNNDGYLGTDQNNPDDSDPSWVEIGAPIY